MIEVKLDAFEGPFDLLLHLIKKNEIDICDIPIAVLTQEYLTYLELMEALDLEIASEFLVMAAYLLWLKSRLLLPQHEDEPDSEDLEENPVASLARRLMEYKAYKEAVKTLDSHWMNQSDRYPRPHQTRDEEERFPVPLNELNLFDLLDAFGELLARQRIVDIPIPQARRSLAGKIRELEKKFKKKSGMWFFDLFEDLFAKEELIITFLALLELVRRRRLFVKQRKAFSKIWIELRS